MCVPNWSSVVLEDEEKNSVKAITVYGECHHTKIYSEYKSPLGENDFYLNEIYPTVERIRKFPFEGIYTRSRIVCWQPNKDLPFYELEEIPSRVGFQLAQVKLEEEIGNLDRLTAWLNMVKNRVCDYEFLGLVPSCKIEKRTNLSVVSAMRELLQAKAGNEFLKDVFDIVDYSREYQNFVIDREEIFNKWLGFFLERNNRINLWQ